MPPETATSKLFGVDVEFTYSETWIAYALFALRLMMGWVFFYAGIVKVIDPNWSARPFLLNVDPANPLVDMWAAMADWVWLLTPLNQDGLTLIGIALLAGAFVRLSAFWGAIMM